ncbi:AAA family ATPase [Phormidesmis sp. 146-12]
MSGFRTAEAERVAEGLRSGQSLLLLGEPGAGKTGVGLMVMDQLKANYTVGMVRYSSTAIELLRELCEQVGVGTTTASDKNLTAAQLRAELLKELTKPQRLLIADDAHKWPAALKDWLQQLWRRGGLLLVLAWEPPAKDIFTKLPVMQLEAISDSQIRELMQEEAKKQGITLSVAELATLQGKAGNNPAIAQRVIKEAALGLTETKSAGHYQYIDGTPFLIVSIMMLGSIRLIGLGLGDKSLYVMGGILTIGGLALRSVLYIANRGASGRKL